MEGEYYADLQSGEEQRLHDHEQRPSEGRAAEPESKGTAVLYVVAAGRLEVFCSRFSISPSFSQRFLIAGG